MLQFPQLESCVHQHIAELRREAENDRLADLAAGPARPRPVRARIAQWLIVAAVWIDGQPDGSIAHAEA